MRGRRITNPKDAMCTLVSKHPPAVAVHVCAQCVPLACAHVVESRRVCRAQLPRLSIARSFLRHGDNVQRASQRLCCICDAKTAQRKRRIPATPETSQRCERTSTCKNRCASRSHRAHPKRGVVCAAHMRATEARPWLCSRRSSHCKLHSLDCCSAASPVARPDVREGLESACAGARLARAARTRARHRSDCRAELHWLSATNAENCAACNSVRWSQRCGWRRLGWR